jgi:alkanesulfonate monooxygenase SsuD/methylene tetrahydromethanopterin reductase-like flavin-dependent oxidoreductase (luciferase family)
MKLYYFSEMPHHEFPDEEGDKYPSLRLEFPNRFFDREKAAANYQRYLTEYEFADQAGFEGLMINEHHSTPSCVNVGVNMTAAVLGRITRRAKILLLGNILPVEENPVRLAEQLAMADLISGGRVLSGFVRGIGVETWWSNTNPVHNRERFEECHDLILKCWTSPGPFRWEGKHYHFRHVNPWCLPLQKPHPPIWTPGTASPETAIWAGRRGYTYVPFLVPAEIARELFDYYRQGAAEVGRTVTPDNLGFLICAVTADTKEKALEAGRHFVWRMGPTLRAPTEFMAPVGMRSRAGAQFALRAAAALAGQHELSGAAGRPVHHRGNARRSDRALRPRPARARHRPPPAGSSGIAHGPPDDDAVDRADGGEGDPGSGRALAAQRRFVSKNSRSSAVHSSASTPPCASTR